MIVADIAVRHGEQHVSSGNHRLVAMPSIGDAILFYDRSGAIVGATVDSVFHYPRREDGLGPDGEPGIIISVTPQDA